MLLNYSQLQRTTMYSISSKSFPRSWKLTNQELRENLSWKILGLQTLMIIFTTFNTNAGDGIISRLSYCNITIICNENYKRKILSLRIEAIVKFVYPLLCAIKGNTPIRSCRTGSIYIATLQLYTFL